MKQSLICFSLVTLLTSSTFIVSSFRSAEHQMQKIELKEAQQKAKKRAEKHQKFEFGSLNQPRCSTKIAVTKNTTEFASLKKCVRYQ